MSGQPGSDIHKLPNALDSRGLVEVTSSNRFPITKDETLEKPRSKGWVPDDIEVSASRDELHLLELHDVLKLYANFSCLAQEFRV